MSTSPYDFNTVASAKELTTYASGSRAPSWWGILLLVFIEITVFSTLIATYFYLYSNATVWPLGDADPPELLLPGINFFVLMASAIPIYYADRAIRRGDKRGLRLGYLIAIILAIIFLTLKYIEYSGLDYFWDTNAYGSIVWTITGFHSAHVIAVMLKASVLLTLAWKGYFSEQRHAAIQGNTLYWLFVVAVWIPLFSTLYIFPNVI